MIQPGDRVRYYNTKYGSVVGTVLRRCDTCSTGADAVYKVSIGDDQICVERKLLVQIQPLYGAYQRKPEAKPLHILDEA